MANWWEQIPGGTELYNWWDQGPRKPLGNLAQAAPYLWDLEMNGFQNMGEAAAAPFQSKGAGLLWELEKNGLGNMGEAAQGALQSPVPNWLAKPWNALNQGLGGPESKVAEGGTWTDFLMGNYGPGSTAPVEPSTPYMYGDTPAAPPAQAPMQQDPLQAFLQRILSGGGGGGGGMGAPGTPLELPAYPDIPFPEAQAPAAFDRTKIDELLAKAQPKAPEDGTSDMGWAMLLGAMQGFDPSGTPGEILGRLVAPAGRGAENERLRQEGEESQYDQAMSQYYQALAGTEGNLENVRLGREDIAQDREYTNQLNARTAQLEKFGMQREDAYKMAELELSRQGLGLQAAQVQQGNVRNQLSAASLLGRYGGGAPKGGLFKMIHDSVSKGMPLPGVDMAQLQMDAMAAVEQQQPGLASMNPTLYNQMLSQSMSNALLSLAQQNPQLAEQWSQMYSQDTGGALDLMSILSGGL